MFTADSVKDMLSNPRYAGRIPPGDVTAVVGNYSAIVDEEAWAAASASAATGSARRSRAHRSARRITR